MLNFLTTFGIVILAESIAHKVAPMEIAPLINTGAIGCVLAWFMLRMEPRQRRLEESNDRLTRQIGNMIIAFKQAIHPSIRDQAEAINHEVDVAESKRKN